MHQWCLWTARHRRDPRVNGAWHKQERHIGLEPYPADLHDASGGWHWPSVTSARARCGGACSHAALGEDKEPTFGRSFEKWGCVAVHPHFPHGRPGTQKSSRRMQSAEVPTGADRLYTYIHTYILFVFIVSRIVLSAVCRAVAR